MSQDNSFANGVVLLGMICGGKKYICGQILNIDRMRFWTLKLRWLMYDMLYSTLSFLLAFFLVKATTVKLIFFVKSGVSQLTTSKTIKQNCRLREMLPSLGLFFFFSSLNSLTSRRQTWHVFRTVEVGSFQDEEGGAMCKTCLGSFWMETLQGRAERTRKTRKDWPSFLHVYSVYPCFCWC